MEDAGLQSKIQRREVAERAWRQFIHDRVAPQGLREVISQSWLRVRESYGIDPGLTHPRRMLSLEALEERRAKDDVLQLASPILGEFADLLPGHVLAYLDGEGWLLTLGGDPSIMERVAEIHFLPGLNWAEESAGTNGPGTALASAKPVEVFAAEHFVAAWQGWSCAAAPLLLAGTTEPVGLIDVTGPWDRQSRQAMTLAKAIARTVEERLRAAASVRGEVIRHALRAAREAGDALVAIDARGRVIAMNDAAQRRRIAEAGVLPPAMRDSLAQLKLPSSEVRMVHLSCRATIGNVGNPEHEILSVGKAGKSRWLGKRPTVRGTAMNPVDHPHGGGEGKASSGRHPVTPWGKPTLGYRTRGVKASDKYIVRRRKGR